MMEMERSSAEREVVLFTDKSLVELEVRLRSCLPYNARASISASDNVVKLVLDVIFVVYAFKQCRTLRNPCYCSA